MSQAPVHHSEAQARVLSKALPYMQHHDGKTIVIKYGGHAMGDPLAAKAFARDVVLLKQSGVNPVVVHGGGPQIAAMLERLGIESTFASGLRVTDERIMEVVEMVLAGTINKRIVSSINDQGGRAVGICGKDGNLLVARKLRRSHKDGAANETPDLDLGFVGEPASVNGKVIETMTASKIIPVIAPVACGTDGQTYNINSDTFAGAIAGALGAKRLLLLTDVSGVLDRSGELQEELTIAQARALVDDGTITAGMIPKVNTCIDALDQGVEASVILNGKVEHAVLLELFTEHGAGTMIVP